MSETKAVIPLEQIQQAIYLLRGQKVMLSTDLARLYRVAPREAVEKAAR